MPYGELLVEDSSVDLDYRFSAKETDRETGLSYFGARYYDPSVAVWLGTDPLWEIEPDKSFYNYCRNNPVNFIDPDGRKPWEDSNVRRARKYADQTGGKFVKWKNKDGYNSAAVHEITCSETNSGYEVVIETNVFNGNEKNNHNVAYNMLRSADEAMEGKSDPANQGTVTSRDVTVGLGVVGVMTGGMSLGTEAVAAGGITLVNAIITGLGIVNSVDDITTDANGESLSTRSVESEFGKGVVVGVKVAIGVANVVNDVKTIKNSADALQKSASVIDAANSTGGVTKAGYDVIKTKIKPKRKK